MPGLEAAHPRGAGLDNLGLHAILVPVAVSPTGDVLGHEISPLNISQRNLLVAVRQGAVKIALHHAGKLMVGPQATPLELLNQSVEEPPRAGLGLA